jgi:hypothetical protein
MKLTKVLKIFICIATFSKVFATTFIPTSFERQVRDSSAIIEAKFVGDTYKKLKSGEVVTESTFSLNKVAGLAPSEIVNKQNFKVLTKGGVWQGIVYKVNGTPKFKKGEEVVLILQKTPFGHVVDNMAMGKYSIEYKNRVKYLKSSIFPNHPSMGEMNYIKFNKIVSHYFGSVLSEINLDKIVYDPQLKKRQTRSMASVKDAEGRDIASISERDKKKKEEPVNIIWLVIILSALGFYSINMVSEKD